VALTDAFARLVPAQRGQRISEAQWASALQKFHREAIAIRKRFALGPFTRALATYHFQKQLFKAGFEAATVRKVVFSLVLNAFTAGV
jgi:hypothetical protein